MPRIATISKPLLLAAPTAAILRRIGLVPTALLILLAPFALDTTTADEPLPRNKATYTWPDGFDAASVSSLRHSDNLPTLEPFDRLAQRLIREHHVPGLAIAVTEGGRLVHASGYGVADLDTGQPVTPQTLFRIASISKPITAVAVLRLASQGAITLDAPLIDQSGMTEPFQEAIKLNGSKVDPRWQEVTVRQALQHRGGWDRDRSFDPMFRSGQFADELQIAPPAGARDVIRVMFIRPLDFDPGTRYAYSNFGYNLLGRVIESKSGMTYEAYVRDEVLRPLGITQMRIGRTRLADRTPGESRYHHPGTAPSVFAADFGQPVPHPYGSWYLEAMDSHGGWIASAIDLARFAAAFDSPDHCPVLDRASIDQMHALPTPPQSTVTKKPNAATEDSAKDDSPQQDPAKADPAKADAAKEDDAVYYSLGWNNRELPGGGVHHWHSGSLPGTSTILIRRHDKKNFIALLNTRHSPKTEKLGAEVDRALHEAAAEVSTWPTHNHFDMFSIAPPD
jgi:N-acyl-D-amino-acid deacylase